LAVHAPEVRVIAADLSAEALQVARENARRHAVSDRVHFVQADLLTFTLQPAAFNLICANLPYIPTETLHKLEIYGREPTLALDGGKDGLQFIRRLMAQAAGTLTPGGVLLLEIESTQGMAARSLARQFFPDAEITLLPDLAGHDRLLKIRT
jgi:release factor glutamine methyltransferase